MPAVLPSVATVCGQPVLSKPPQEISRGKLLGQGAYGKAHRVQFRDPTFGASRWIDATEKRIRFRPSRSRTIQDEERDFLRENLNLRFASDQAVYATVLEHPDQGVMYYDFVEGDEAWSFAGNLSVEEGAWFLIYLVAKLADLERKGMVHGDLYPRNVIFRPPVAGQDHLPEFTLIDWGRSCGFVIHQVMASFPDDRRLASLARENECSTGNSFTIWEFRAPFSFHLTDRSRRLPLLKRMLNCVAPSSSSSSSAPLSAQEQLLAETAVLQRSDLWSAGMSTIFLLWGYYWYSRGDVREQFVNGMRRLGLGNSLDQKVLYELNFQPKTGVLLDQLAPSSEFIAQVVGAAPRARPSHQQRQWKRLVDLWNPDSDPNVLADRLNLILDPKSLCVTANDLKRAMLNGQSAFFREAMKAVDRQILRRFESKCVPADQVHRGTTAPPWGNSPYKLHLDAPPTNLRPARPTTPVPPASLPGDAQREFVRWLSANTPRLLALSSDHQFLIPLPSHLADHLRQSTLRLADMSNSRLKTLRWSRPQDRQPPSRWVPLRNWTKWTVSPGEYFALFVTDAKPLTSADLRQARDVLQQTGKLKDIASIRRAFQRHANQYTRLGLHPVAFYSSSQVPFFIEAQEIPSSRRSVVEPQALELNFTGQPTAADDS